MAQFTLPPVYPILDTATLDRLEFDCIAAAEAMLEGGARILQIRHKGFWSRDTFALAEQVTSLCRSAGVPFFVNDRADFAAVLNANSAATGQPLSRVIKATHHVRGSVGVVDGPSVGDGPGVDYRVGLHLGQEDLAPSDARLVVGHAPVIGFSTHSPAQMLAAANQPVDYLAFGPMFPTVSKERPDPTVGIEGLKAIRALTSKPLVAIGGITRDNAFTCWNAGADSVAVIADLYPNPCTKITLRDRMAEWQSLKAR